MKARYVVKTGQRRHVVQIREAGDGYEITIDEQVHRVDASRISGTPVRSILIEGRSYEVSTVQDGDRYDVYLSGEMYPVEVYDEIWARVQEDKGPAGGREEIQAPIPGAVVKILVKPGDTVEPGAPVAILEAMKMQNELIAVGGGVVKEVMTRVGDTVAQGQTLVVLLPAGSSDP